MKTKQVSWNELRDAEKVFIILSTLTILVVLIISLAPRVRSECFSASGLNEFCIQNEEFSSAKPFSEKTEKGIRFGYDLSVFPPLLSAKPVVYFRINVSSDAQYVGGFIFERVLKSVDFKNKVVTEKEVYDFSDLVLKNTGWAVEIVQESQSSYVVSATKKEIASLTDFDADPLFYVYNKTTYPIVYYNTTFNNTYACFLSSTKNSGTCAYLPIQINQTTNETRIWVTVNETRIGDVKLNVSLQGSNSTIKQDNVVFSARFDNNLSYDDTGVSSGTTVGNPQYTSFGRYFGGVSNDNGWNMINFTRVDGGRWDLRRTNFTVGFWVKPTSSSNGNFTRILETRNASNNAVFGCGYYPVYRAITCSISNSTGGSVQNTPHVALSTEVWNHVVVVVNRQGTGNITVYVNGEFKNKVVFGSNINDNTDLAWVSDRFCIGAQCTSTTQSFNGTLDEVVVFNKSLTQEEVTQLYEAQNYNYDNFGEKEYDNFPVMFNVYNTTKIVKVDLKIWSDDNTNNTLITGILLNSTIGDDIWAPTVQDLTFTPNPANQSQPITINVTVSDGFGVANVTANITLPNGTTYSYVMGHEGENKYSLTYTTNAFSPIGNYTVRIIANDTAGNTNSYVTGQFTVVDVTPPSISVLLPTNMTKYDQSETVLVTCEVHDNIEVETVLINYTNKSITQTHLMNETSNGKYTFSIIPGSIGIDYFFCFANDTAGNTNSSTQIQINITNTLPPTINKITPENDYSTLNGSIVTFSVNATDATGLPDKVNSVWVQITVPDGNTSTYSLLNTSGSEIWELNFSETQQLGDYYYFVFANDTAGNTNSAGPYWFYVNKEHSLELLAFLLILVCSSGLLLMIAYVIDEKHTILKIIFTIFSFFIIIILSSATINVLTAYGAASKIILHANINYILIMTLTVVLTFYGIISLILFAIKKLKESRHVEE